jgi:NADPH:quinone reductase-like Zn-dependent oxidoreductase
MSFEEGAALFVNYLSAYQMLFRIAALKPGDVCLIHLAAGKLYRL